MNMHFGPFAFLEGWVLMLSFCGTESARVLIENQRVESDQGLQCWFSIAEQS